MLDRRSFLATLAFAGLPPHLIRAAASYWTPRVSENLGDIENETLNWLAQMGLEWVVLQGTDQVDRSKKGYWTEDDIEAVQTQCQAHGLKLASLMIPLAWLTPAMLGVPERDNAIERIARSIRAGGKRGVAIFEWRWSPDFKWGEDVGYFDEPGRGGATYKAFDYANVKDKPPFDDLGEIPRQVVLDRAFYFLDRILPVAEEAKVRLSLHPKDPPVPSMRGVERILTNTGQIEDFFAAKPSKMNGFTFCQGTVTEMGVDVIEAIRRLGGKDLIHHVHFRAVRGRVPRYTEVFMDEGDVDMLAAMQAYKDTDYQWTLVSDHTPKLPGEIGGGKVGRSFSQGFIRGLIQSVNHPDLSRRSRSGSNERKGQPKLKLAMGLRDVSAASLSFARQMGVEWVQIPPRMIVEQVEWPLVPSTDRGPSGRPFRAWKAEDLRKIRERVESYGLKAGLIHMSGFDRITLGLAGWQKELEAVKQSIRAAGKAGIPVVEYGFRALRPSEGYGVAIGRGGARLRDFDYSRIRNLKPLPNVGRHTRERVWNRLERFLKAVVPVAEQAGVKLAIHPDDPPVEEFRGVELAVIKLEDLRRLIRIVDSPANGITLDTGVMTEIGANAIDVIREFGQAHRINHVHFRNVRVQQPVHQYVETFHDEGDCDMPGAMLEFAKVDYQGILIPDHTPEFTMDRRQGTPMGWAFAMGYMKALEHAATT